MEIRRFRAPILLGVVTILALILLTSDRTDPIQDRFKLDAAYDGMGNVRITFLDMTEDTDTATLQILGMGEPYFKTFEGYEFVEDVQFQDVPKYGWKTSPVVIDIEHVELGHVQLKTEIYSPGEPVPPVIFARP